MDQHLLILCTLLPWTSSIPSMSTSTSIITCMRLHFSYLVLGLSLYYIYLLLINYSSTKQLRLTIIICIVISPSYCTKYKYDIHSSTCCLGISLATLAKPLYLRVLSLGPAREKWLAKLASAPKFSQPLGSIEGFSWRRRTTTTIKKISISWYLDPQCQTTWKPHPKLVQLHSLSSSEPAWK